MKDKGFVLVPLVKSVEKIILDADGKLKYGVALVEPSFSLQSLRHICEIGLKTVHIEFSKTKGC